MVEQLCLNGFTLCKYVCNDKNTSFEIAVLYAI